MVRIGNETGHRSEDGERFNFEVCSGRDDHILVEGNVRVVFFVDIEIFHQAFLEEIFKVDDFLFEKL
jgi:hypothetical protein